MVTEKDADRAPGRLRAYLRFASFLSLAATAAVGLATIFIVSRLGFRDFDDEGALLIGFRMLAEGRILYDEIYSFYGPFYYLVYGGLYGLVGGVPTHDHVRLMAAVAWSAGVLLATLASTAITRSVLAGGVAGFLVFRLMSVTPHSPGHPESLCLLLLFLLVLVAWRIDRGAGTALHVLAGALIAAGLLVKVNVGIFMGAGWALFLATRAGEGGRERAVAGVLAVTVLLMPSVLMASLAEMPWVRAYAVCATATIGAALLTATACPPARPFSLVPWLASAAGFAIGLATIIGAMVLSGSSVTAMLEMILFQTPRFVRNWYVSFDVGAEGLAAASLALVTAAAWAILARRRAGIAADRLLRVLKWCVALVLAGVVFNVMLPGATPDVLQPTRAFWLIVPFSWLILARSHDAPLGPGRRLLGLVAAIFSLYSFPVAGHQTLIAFVPLAVLGTVLLHDAFIGHAARAGAALRWRQAAGAGVAVVLLAAASLHLVIARNWQGYSEPLALPGAGTIGIAPKIGSSLRWVVAQLEGCEASYSLPGLMSFHIWAGHAPPTGLNINHPLAFLTHEQQRQVIADLARHPGLCIVQSQTVLEFLDRGQLATNPPLLAHIQQEFVQVGERGGYALLRRRSEIQTAGGS